MTRRATLPAQQPLNDFQERLRAEEVLIGRLGDHGADIEDGLTDFDLRRERLRAVINQHDLGQVIVGRGTDGKSITYRRLFRHIYGEDL